jgi:hypothetical protein
MADAKGDAMRRGVIASRLGEWGMAAGSAGYRACVVAAATILAAAAFGGHAAADDGDICANESGDVAIAACTRAINSGRYKGNSLAVKYNNRGVEWRLKQDYERALSDYSAAIRYDETFADASTAP